MNRATVYDDKVYCISDLEREATLKLPPMARDFYNGGSMDLKTVAENKSAYDRYRLRPRVMIDVSKVDPSTECLGSNVSFPLGFSPSANHGMTHPDAEAGTSRAAAKKGVNMVLSSWTNTPPSIVVQQGIHSENSYAHQLSIVKDEETNMSIIRNAEAAGFKALFVSVDCPWLGRRLNEMKNCLTLPEDCSFPCFPFLESGASMITDDPRLQYAANLEWSFVKDLKKKTKLQIWLKGILTAEDAELAIQAGADGIVLSNHGGRQLDGALATIDALPEIVKQVKGRIPVHIDGGIRRGSDIFKALALGADYCWVGRVALWGLAYKGEEGVSIALNILYDEFCLVMALMGCKSIKDIGPQHLARMATDGTFHKLNSIIESKL